jgi:hypothetical protein
MAPSVLTLGIQNGGGVVNLTLNNSAFTQWDGKNEQGVLVPMGFYHVIVTQTFTDGSQVQLQNSVYWGDHAPVASVILQAAPNWVTAGGTVQFTAQVDGNAVNASGAVRIYSLSGEFLRQLDLAGGRGVWDLTNPQGDPVASGIYLVVLDTKDANGNPARKVIKVGIKH